MVVDQVRELGVDLILGKMVGKFLTDENHGVTGVAFKDGDTVEGACVCVAVGLSSVLVNNAGSNLSHRLESLRVMTWQGRLVLNVALVEASLSAMTCSRQ